METDIVVVGGLSLGIVVWGWGYSNISVGYGDVQKVKKTLSKSLKFCFVLGFILIT